MRNCSPLSGEDHHRELATNIRHGERPFSLVSSILEDAFKQEKALGSSQVGALSVIVKSSRRFVASSRSQTRGVGRHREMLIVFLGDICVNCGGGGVAL